MRIHRSTVAVLASVASLACGGGVAWACPGPGDPASSTGTTWAGTTSTSTTSATTTNSTAASATQSSRRSSRSRRHARRHSRRA